MCDISLKCKLAVVSVVEEDEYVVELKDVLYARNLGYNIFSPSAGFDGENRDRVGHRDISFV